MLHYSRDSCTKIESNNFAQTFAETIRNNARSLHFDGAFTNFDVKSNYQ